MAACPNCRPALKPKSAGLNYNPTVVTPMTRALARDKTGHADYMRLVCPCGKRLALLDETLPGMIDGPNMAPMAWVVIPGPDGDAGTWWQLKCPRCKRDWRGREDRLLRLVRAARARRAAQVTLED